MKKMCLSALAVALLLANGTPPDLPIPNDYANSIKTRWLNKKVLESRLLDDAENLATWKLVNTGQALGEMALTRERAVSGASAVRLTSPTTGDKPIPTVRHYGGAAAVRVVNGEDWSAWNRLSFWVYPDLPGFRNVSLLVMFHNEGKEAVPDTYGKMGLNYLILQNQQWNHVVWEIANLTRDKVTGIEFSYRLQGNEPGAATRVLFDIDKLELEKVNADHYEGWNVAPGEISFSHSGYQTGSPKSAIASDLEAAEFQLINVETGVPAVTKKVSPVTTQIGRFQVMDFSEVREPGSYILRAGNRTTRPFRIGTDVWKPSLWKAINFFYVERCGYAIPGVHDACHRDWMLNHGDKKLIVNGGWHDAGDLSQSLPNTAEAAYAMFSLAERLQARGEDPALLARLLEEAKWGLDWLLKTTFHDGFRPGFSTMDRWTNGILGDTDDMVSQAANNPGSNIAAVATEAIAARVLRKSDPVLAEYSLKQAKEDWEFAVSGMAERQRGTATEMAGHAALAALELWQATGERKYADQALGFATTIANSQQRAFLPGLAYPLAGFFYTGPDKARILRYSHPSHEDAPVVALTRMCELFPNHADWIKWYSAVTLYSEYFQKAMAQFTQPYGMLANSVFHDEEYKQAASGGRGGTAEAFREQVLNGVKVGEHHYVRLFPVWFEFRGNHGTVLTQTKAISAAAPLRGNFELASLAQQQLQWVVGRNPFVQSTMWGEGYDYAPQYTAMSGDIVGSLPVGIQAHRNGDQPYWPAENCHNWKEVWVHPVARWIWLMRDLAGPAQISGSTNQGSREPLEFREKKSGKTVRIDPDPATFRTWLAEGEYEVAAAGAKRTMVLLPGGSYDIDFRAGRQFEFSAVPRTGNDGSVSLAVTMEGSGRHSLAVRTDNLSLVPSIRQVELQAGQPQTITMQGKMTALDAPWVAVLVADDDVMQRKEITGAVRRP
ncbi:MAG: glycoside hydrolase family 9 protein [Candidatus Solibacter sp.]|nr:glycoside hydrolase family 9 protein [Candidatus Solibacter sp.]